MSRATQVTHYSDCKCEKEHTFTCPMCCRVVGWCMGAYDDTPALCDDCSNRLFEDIAEAQDSSTASAHRSGLADEAMTSRVVPNGADSGRFPKVRFT